MRFVDIIQQEMDQEKNEQGIVLSRLSREVLSCLNELSSERVFSEFSGWSRISIGSIKSYIEIYDPPVPPATLSRLVKMADSYEIGLKTINKK